ncbi:aldose reductase-related protein 2-like isoform X2 [Portunus trituberculatus]|uniref:aldose reductase-related protein 2-like isoform X2 n=1 Tax=Portunus trituberculatus TaxID=210409 RepID=UPI001E1CF392|nr:aldose reductase-related protein 2-like isoform X2 [Portunus trituberculatus]
MAERERKDHVKAEDKEATAHTHSKRRSYRWKSRKKEIETVYVWLPTLGVNIIKNHKNLVRQLKELRQAGVQHIQVPLSDQLSATVLQLVCDFFKKKKCGMKFFISTSVVVPEEPALLVQRLEELYLYLGQRPVDLLLLENPVGLRGSNYTQIYNKNEDGTWPPVRRLFQRSSDGQLVIPPNIMQNLSTVWRLLETELWFQVIKRGLAMHLGLRNFTLFQIQELLNVVKLKPIIVQAELNLYFRQKKLRSFCSNNNITVCAIYPFGSPYTDSRNLPVLTQHRSVRSIAHKLDTSPKAVLLRYLLVYDIPVVIDNSMARGAAHLIQTVYEIKLEEKHMEKLSAVQQSQPKRVLTEFELWQKKFPLWPFYIKNEEEKCISKKTGAGRTEKHRKQTGMAGSLFTIEDTHSKGKVKVKE